MAATDARVVVVGAGPHALTVCAWLASRGVGGDGDVVVVDPRGRFLSAWDDSFARMGIPHLRSPSVHHPHPNPHALVDFAARTDRLDELHGHYRLPGRQLFSDFCCELIDELHLARWVRADAAVAVEASGSVLLAGGDRLRARHVVVAHNPREPVIPVGLENDSAVHHAADLDLRLERPSGTVVVVGGGLTAAQLAVGACEAGGEVVLVHRRPLVRREFDSDPGWLGPKEMAAFDAEPDPIARAAMARAARGGGTVPGWMLDRLNSLVGSGRLRMLCGEVERVRGDRVKVVEYGGSSTTVEASAVWLGTGWSLDVDRDRLLGPLLRSCRTVAPGRGRVVDGLPVVDRSLRLHGTAVVLGGRLAQLQLGPTAGNLAGARRLAACVGMLVEPECDWNPDDASARRRRARTTPRRSATS